MNTLLTGNSSDFAGVVFGRDRWLARRKAGIARRCRRQRPENARYSTPPLGAFRFELPGHDDQDDGDEDDNKEEEEQEADELLATRALTVHHRLLHVLVALREYSC